MRATKTTFLLLGIMFSGCFCGDPQEDPGTLVLAWSFPDEDSCNDAFVDSIDVDVIDADGTVQYEGRDIDCGAAGLSVEDLDAGTYNIFIDAKDERGNIIYEGSRSNVSVAAGSTADVGVIELSLTGAHLAFFWSFDGVEDCAIAGVDSIDLYLDNATTGENEEAFTADCFGGGLIINRLDPGTYDLFVDAYDENDQLLFIGDYINLALPEGEITDIGVIDLIPADGQGGRISVDWTFATGDCASNGIAEVDVNIYEDDGGSLNRVASQTAACEDGTATVSGIDPGAYVLHLDAYTSNDELEYVADANVVVDDGQLTTVGELELLPYGAGVTFLWAYRYPGADLESDCQRAGVTSIEVTVESAGNAPGYSETFPCDDMTQGVTVDSLTSGEYTLRIEAKALFDGMDYTLYSAAPTMLTVPDSGVLDLETVPLERNDANFSNINVAWSVLDGSCADLDPSIIAFSITRIIDAGTRIEDDSFSEECSTLTDMRQTFAPGLYEVTATNGTYAAEELLEVAPGSVPMVQLSLESP